ncbi:hypothetical protein [Microbacterium aurantiacum]|uniref:Uncharacterized protein n=1 Tax=Microbacterium aurantiacum TaxID=162393 RepID=A0ABT8FRE7_9MICO|nr:hypothetical protein [Microbacterium aurantiacum]MDN4463892.1 hypothetical protein [Microbacterium aurantiacum]
MRFSDVEADAIGFLVARFELPASLRVPSPRPPEFYRVYGTGGDTINRVLDAPQITVDAWAEDDERARRMADDARMAFLDRRGELPLWRRVEASSPYFIPDPETETPVYRFTLRPRVRATRSTPPAPAGA